MYKEIEELLMESMKINNFNKNNREDDDQVWEHDLYIDNDPLQEIEDGLELVNNILK